MSECIVSRLTGEDIFFISRPIYYKNKIIGIIQKQFTPENMHELESASLFSDKGYALHYKQPETISAGA